MWVSQAVGGISLGVAVGMRRQQAEEKGKLPLVSRISLGLMGRRQDLCECRRPSAGSLGVADGTSTTGEGGRVGVGAWRLQRHSLERRSCLVK